MGLSPNAPTASYTHKLEDLLKFWLKYKHSSTPVALNSSETSPAFQKSRQATRIKYDLRLGPKRRLTSLGKKLFAILILGTNPMEIIDRAQQGALGHKNHCHV